MNTRNAQVLRVADLTHDVRQIDLALTDAETFRFDAGQFVSFHVARPGHRQGVTRPYSIASAPGGHHGIELLLNRVPGGTVSSYLFGLRPGDRTSFTGPAGTFCLRHAADKRLLFVATGTGIAPVRSMLLSLADAGAAVPITLFWGVRSERDVYYEDELRRLRQRLPQLACTITLSRPTGRWSGQAGTVTSLVEHRIASVENLAAYVCGNESMIKDVTAALRTKGLCPIHREQYFRDLPRAS